MKSTSELHEPLKPVAPGSRRNQTIRGVRIHEFGEPEVLRIERVEVEEPGEGEVHIRIRAIGINRTEITPRSGPGPTNFIHHPLRGLATLNIFEC